MPKVHTLESIVRCICYDPEHRIYWIEKELENGYVLSVYGFSKKSVANVVRRKMTEHLRLMKRKTRGRRRR